MSQPKTCKTCRFWDARTMIGGYGTCDGVPYNDDDQHTALAYVVDAENYAAWLRTKPEFSCVIWEGKEERS